PTILTHFAIRTSRLRQGLSAMPPALLYGRTPLLTAPAHQSLQSSALVAFLPKSRPISFLHRSRSLSSPGSTVSRISPSISAKPALVAAQQKGGRSCNRAF